MKVFLGADHGGFELKGKLLEWLGLNGYETVDCGDFAKVGDDDYVDWAEAVALKMRDDRLARGILICRNGVGMQIVANRFRWMRCGLGFSVEMVRSARNDDDINCLSLPGDFVREQEAVEYTRVFLETEFSGVERFVRRLEKLKRIV